MLQIVNSMQEPCYSEWLQYMKPPYLSEADGGTVRVAHPDKILPFQVLA